MPFFMTLSRMAVVVAAMAGGGGTIADATVTPYHDEAEWIAAVEAQNLNYGMNDMQPGSIPFDTIAQGGAIYQNAPVDLNQTQITVASGEQLFNYEGDDQFFRSNVGITTFEHKSTKKFLQAFGIEYRIRHWPPLANGIYEYSYALHDVGTAPSLTVMNLTRQEDNHYFFGVVSDEPFETPQAFSINGSGKRLRFHKTYWALYSPPMFDFAIALDNASISLTKGTDFTEAIVFQYSYTGTKAADDDSVDFTFDILQGDCDTAFALAGNTTQALFWTAFDETVPDKVSAKLGMNLSTIESASEVWSHPDGDETQAILHFCGRWNIKVGGILFQYHETNVTATIDMKEDDGFEVTDLNVGLDRKDANTESQDIDVEFPLNVFFCNDSAIEETPATTEFAQGTPIQLCIELETVKPGVFVQGIDTLLYWATKVTDKNETLIEGGTVQYLATAEADCSQVPGRCRVKFLAIAAMFVNTADNQMVVSGFATVAFGDDPDGRRQVAVSGPYENRLLDEVEDNDDGRLTSFEFTVGRLQPLSEKELSPKKPYGILFSALGGIVLVVFAIIFVKCRNRETPQKPCNKESEDTTKLPENTSHEASESSNVAGYHVANV